MNTYIFLFILVSAYWALAIFGLPRLKTPPKVRPVLRIWWVVIGILFTVSVVIGFIQNRGWE